MSSHVACVTEHDKYAKGATKPGGAAANGFFNDNGAAGAPAAAAPAAARSSDSAVEGAEHLSTRFPWKCHLCSVQCTSQETLAGHASGLKHRRRARAAAKNNSGKGGNEEGGEEEEGAAEDGAVAASPSTPPQKGAVSEAPAKEQKKKEKKRKQEEDGGGDDDKGSDSKKQKKQPKWKKLALSVLSLEGSSKKGMKVSKLLDAVLKAAGISNGKKDEKRKEEALASWRSSGKFLVEGGRVALA